MTRNRGFSLIELMVTITIVVLLILMALPSYSQWLTNTRIRNAAESIHNGLQFARNEAVQRNTNVASSSARAAPTGLSACCPRARRAAPMPESHSRHCNRSLLPAAPAAS